MQLCVFGASGPVGRAVVGQALHAGHGVTAVTRRPDRFGLTATGLRVVNADITVLDQVESAFDGAEAVISTIGVNPSRKPVTTYSVGAQHLLEAMRTRGLRRIVCVSSKNVAGPALPGDPILFRLLLGPLLHRISRTIYADMSRMEQLLRGSDRAWTVVRPAGLFAADRISDYRCTSGHQPGVFTSVVDLADALIAEVVSERPHVGETLEVLTDADTPSLARLMVGQITLHRR